MLSCLPLLKAKVPEVVERKYLPPRWIIGWIWSHFEVGWWFRGKESFRCGFQAKPNHCKLETVFNTVLGHKKPTSLLKHLSSPSKETTCLQFWQLIKARFVCWTGPEKHLPEILSLSGVKCCTTQKLSLSVIYGANSKIFKVKPWPLCSTSTIGLARTDKPCSNADIVNLNEWSVESLADKWEDINLSKSE